jgi:hypothetical protein
VFVVLVAGLITTGALALHMASRPGVYWSQVNVLFLAPQSAKYPNGLQITSDSLITTAGVIGKMVGSSQSGPQVVSDAVTLVSEGAKHGYSVRLPDDGGQWAHNFDQPLLDVQAVGTSVGEVNSTLDTVLGEIQGDLSKMQRSDNVAKVNLVRTRLSPSIPPTYYQAGSHMRAAAASLVLGSGITVAAASLVGRRAARLNYVHSLPVATA